jgi:hypothetical protein
MSDDFSDVRDMVNGLGAGILAGDGVEHHNRVKSKISEDGTGFDHQLRCDHCGYTLVVGIPWAELIIMGQGVLPPNNEWQHDGRNGCFRPNKGCPHCGDAIRLGITPDECNRNLSSGIAARKITREAIQGYIQRSGVQQR